MYGTREGNSGQFRRRGGSQPIRPFVYCGTEGDTEKNYLDYIDHQHLKNVRLLTKQIGGHGKTLIDETILHAGAHTRQSGRRPTHLAVVYDIETPAEHALAQALEIVDYGKRNNVSVFVNGPVMERWLLLHVQNVPSGLSVRELNRRLALPSTLQLLKNYNKPGDFSFYDSLYPLIETARTNCQRNPIEHRGNHLPCMCDFLSFLEYIDQNSK
jgi:hypothetical protein